MNGARGTALKIGGTSPMHSLCPLTGYAGTFLTGAGGLHNTSLRRREAQGAAGAPSSSQMLSLPGAGLFSPPSGGRAPKERA